MRSPYPPGPPDDFLGRKHAVSMREDPGEFGLRLQHDYGDVVHFRLGPFHCYQLTHPEHIEQVLVTKAKSFRKPRRLKQVFGRFEGDGLVLSDGPFWARQHRLVKRAFAPARLRLYAAEVTRIAGPVIDDWGVRGKIDLSTDTRRIGLRIIIQTLFSSCENELTDEVRIAVDAIQQWAKSELHRVVATPRWMPIMSQPTARHAIAFVRQFVRRMLLQRQSAQGPHYDMLDALLDTVTSRVAADRMSDQQLYDELVTLLLAGHETTAAALSWTIWLLANDRDTQEQIAAEVRNAIANRQVEFSDLPRLPTVQAALKEAMRMYPPVYLISREVAEIVEVAGYELKSGSQVFLNLYVTHRDPRWFPNPLQFNPGRFKLANTIKLPRCAWLPFGAGPRACLGQEFAMMETTLILASLPQQYRLSPAAEQDEPESEWQLSLHPRGKLVVDLTSRRT